MSWLKEVENILAIQKAEQTTRERTERTRERERIEGWKIFVDQTLGRLLTHWDNLEIDDILKDVQDVVWPGLKIHQTIAIPIKDKEIMELSRETVEVDEKVKNLFGTYVKTSTIEGWRGYSRQGGLRKGRKIADVTGAIIDSGYSAGDVENPYIRASIYHTFHWEGHDSEYYNDPPRDIDVDKFSILLFERKVEVIVGEEDLGNRFQLDEVPDSDALKRRIAQILRGEVGKT